MLQLQLYIENQRVELFKDESVSLTQTIQNIKDISKVFTEFTQSFTIPASKENNKIFKHYYNYDIDNGFDGRKKASAIIELNQLPFKEGKVKLNGVNLKDNKPYAYKITFFGNTINLKDKLGDTKLSALTWLDNFAYDYTNTDVRTLLQSDGADITVDSTTYTNALICPLISNTTRLYYDSGAHGSNDPQYPDPLGGNLEYVTGTSHHHGVYWEELKYALRLHLIVLAIENEPNLDIEFTSDSFIKDTTNDQYYQLYMWLHKKKGFAFEENQPFTQLYNSFLFDNISMTRATMYSDKLVISGLIGSQVILYDLNITTTYTGSFTIYVKKDGVDYITPITVSGSTNYTFGGNLINSSGGYQVYIETNTTISSLTVEWDLNDFKLLETHTFTGSAQNFVLTRSFNAQEQIPDMKIIDFLSGLFTMFNLTAFQQNDGKIRVLPLDTFYAEGQTRNVTDYIDAESSEVNLALPYKEIKFQYKGRGTKLAKLYERENLIGWGSVEYKGDDNYDGSVYKIEAPFEHMQFERLIDVDTNTDTDIQVGWFADDNNDAYFGSPLLFYATQETSSQQISFLNVKEHQGGGSHQAITTYMRPQNSVNVSSLTNIDTNHFSVEVNAFTPTEIFNGSLFSNYYQNYISDVFNNKRRISKFKAQLPVSFLVNYSLADELVIGDKTYLINSIKTNLQTGKSDLELLNKVSLDFNTLTDVGTSSGGGSITMFYPRSLGYANNLNVGDKLYQDALLTTGILAGTYYQVGSSATTTICNAGYENTFVVDSNSLITSKVCA
jgi:hypothetical protein